MHLAAYLPTSNCIQCYSGRPCPHISSSDRQKLTVSGWRRAQERSQTNQVSQKGTAATVPHVDRYKFYVLCLNLRIAKVTDYKRHGKYLLDIDMLYLRYI